MIIGDHYSDFHVVGGGDSALEEGIFLTRYAKSVKIVHRRDELRAGQILQNRARSNPKIEFVWNTVLEEIIGEQAVESVRFRNVLTNEESIESIDGVFVFIGHIPNTSIFEGQIEMDDLGYLINDRFMQTNIPGVYTAGEVSDSHFRQVITSAGMGAAAAIQAGHFLQETSND